MRDLIQNNFVLKILSLVLATLLWFAIDTSLLRKEATLDLPFPVAALVPVAVERFFSITPAKVQVKLAGSQETLRELEVTTNLAVFVRVPPDLKSEATLDVEVKLPPAVRLLYVNPPRVSVKPNATTN